METYSFRCLILLYTFIMTFCNGYAVAMTHFVDKNHNPIDDVIVDGNREITRYEILKALDMGPDNIGTAIKVMRAVLPYFREVKWRVVKKDNRRIAHIHVVEKGRIQYKRRPVIAFNRVHGWRLGIKTEASVARNLRSPALGKIFGEVSRGFSSGRWNYQLGVEHTGGWWKRYGLHIGTSIYRATDVRDRDILPSNGEQVTAALFYGGDMRDYYQRSGSEIFLHWAAKNRRHFDLRLRDEYHSSLDKHSDWSFFSRKEPKQDNLPITEGRLKSVMVSYSFNTLAKAGGWLNDFTVEHSNQRLSSDFHFTVGQMRLRYIYLADNSFLNFRSKAGVSTNCLPIQRKFIIGGFGTLRGYRFREFMGDNLLLANVEFGRKTTFYGMFLVFFVDVGYVWDDSSLINFDDAKISPGIAIQFGGSRRDADVNVRRNMISISSGAFFRINFAQALESGRKPIISTRLQWMF